jgi:hypothetical protein
LYSFEGIPLENKTLGWKIITGTSFFTPSARATEGVTIPGRDGVEEGPGTIDAPVHPIVMYTRKENLESLLALWGLGRGHIVNDVTGRRVWVSVVTATPEGGGPENLHVKVTIIVRLPSVYWCDVVETTYPAVNLTTTSQIVPALDGLSAPVRDAIIRVEGQANGLQVKDSAGSFFRYTLDIPSTTWFRFEAATGKAFTTTTDVWTGGTEVTGLLVNGPGAYPLQITPKFTTDPRVRAGELTVTTTSRTAARLEVRGRRRYVAI